ncbi:hypothetical protein [Nocardia mikamii]|uniref:hypothetical protein n=1 Tax=Nocardia mikamii TaxID=508464 RepID=UPI001FDFC528|nr:hypothetical protein [Nocardia mikamii]
MTELSRVIKNWPEPSTAKTSVDPEVAPARVVTSAALVVEPTRDDGLSIDIGGRPTCAFVH